MLDCDAHLEKPVFHVPDKSSINIKHKLFIKTINNKHLQSYVIRVFFLVSKWHSNCSLWSRRRRFKKYWGLYTKFSPKIIAFMLCGHWTAKGLEVFDVDSENKVLFIIVIFWFLFRGRVSKYWVDFYTILYIKYEDMLYIKFLNSGNSLRSSRCREVWQDY